MPLTIVAHIHATAGKESLVEAELSKLVDATRAEAGCLKYDLHRDNGDPAYFMFYETWETRELWQQHMRSAHIAAFGRATEGAVARSAVHEMTRIA